MSTSVQDLLKALKGIEQQLQIFQVTRQSTLETLTKRRDTLSAELAAVEPDLAALTTATAPGTPGKAPSSSPAAPADANQSLSALLVDILGRASVAMSSKALCEAALLRGYQTKSENFQRIVDNRLSRLRAEGQIAAGPDGGYQALRPAAAAAAPAGDANGAADEVKPRRRGGRKAKVKQAKTGKKRGPSLGVVITDVLTRAGRALTAQEMADEALKLGVETTSTNFKDVVWVTLGKMKQGKVAQVAGQRWELTGA